MKKSIVALIIASVSTVAFAANVKQDNERQTQNASVSKPVNEQQLSNVANKVLVVAKQVSINANNISKLQNAINASAYYQENTNTAQDVKIAELKKLIDDIATRQNDIVRELYNVKRESHAGIEDIKAQLRSTKK